MFFLNFASVWSFSFFLLITYITLFMSLLLYLIPLSSSTPLLTNNNSIKHNFYMITGNEVQYLIFCFATCVFSIALIWSSSDVSSWFGHLIFTSFHSKMVYLISFMFFLITYLFCNTNYFSSNELYDFFITKFVINHQNVTHQFCKV